MWRHVTAVSLQRYFVTTTTLHMRQSQTNSCKPSKLCPCDATFGIRTHTCASITLESVALLNSWLSANLVPRRRSIARGFIPVNYPLLSAVAVAARFTVAQGSCIVKRYKSPLQLPTKETGCELVFQCETGRPRSPGTTSARGRDFYASPKSQGLCSQASRIQKGPWYDFNAQRRGWELSN